MWRDIVYAKTGGVLTQVSDFLQLWLRNTQSQLPWREAQQWTSHVSWTIAKRSFSGASERSKSEARNTYQRKTSTTLAKSSGSGSWSSSAVVENDREKLKSSKYFPSMVTGMRLQCSVGRWDGMGISSTVRMLFSYWNQNQTHFSRQVSCGNEPLCKVHSLCGFQVPWSHFLISYTIYRIWRNLESYTKWKLRFEVYSH